MNNGDVAPIVYVAAKNMRGTWASCEHIELPMKVDVTSAQGKSHANRVAFSPMHMGEPYVSVEEGEYPNFEAYWQSLKLIENVEHDEAKLWWKTIKQARRRHPKMKGNKVLGAVHKRFPNERIGYVASRKKIYVPDYYEMIKDKAHTSTLRALALHGEKPLIVYDFDGPRNEAGEPTIERVNVELLKNKINDTTTPFGHGYVVAATLAGILPAEYCA